MEVCTVSESTKFIIVGILMSIALLLPQINSASQNPIDAIEAAIERHLVLESTVAAHSAHSHDNGTFEEASLAHQHGHNSADHTHNTLYLLPQNLLLGLKSSIWPSAYQRNHLSPVPLRWQRPPKSNQLS